MATREQIVQALFDVLKGSTAFVTTSRRNRAPESMSPAETPALFLVENEDQWDRTGGFNELPKRTMHLLAIVYSDVGADVNAIPGTIINNILDAIEAATAPDDVINGTFTLGGRVQAVTLDGLSQRASGDVTGKGLAVVPIRILIP